MIQQTVADDQADLSVAFDTFSEVADRVQTAYRALQACASRLDRDLARANARLRCQVDALENLSGSLAAVLRAIPSGVVVADNDGMIVMANPAAEEILGLKGNELIGRAATDLTDARGAPLLRLIEGAGETRERIVQTARGARILDGCVVPATDTDDNVLGLVEVMNDRSEVKALQEEVRRLDNLAELGRVAAILAHEIRNPLSGIRGFAGMLDRHLADREGESDARRWTRRICEGVGRADAIIDSVLYLARPRPLMTRRVDVEAMICDVLESVAAGSPSLVRGVRLEHSVKPPGLCVSADEVRIKQAVGNLVQNGIEAMAGDGRLDVVARAVDGAVEIEVRDTGPGFTESARERLFEPFFTTKDDGAGLGLALVQRIAEVHRGTVEARSCRTGTAIVIRIPVDRPDDHQEASLR